MGVISTLLEQYLLQIDLDSILLTMLFMQVSIWDLTMVLFYKLTLVTALNICMLNLMLFHTLKLLKTTNLEHAISWTILSECVDFIKLLVPSFI